MAIGESPEGIRNRAEDKQAHGPRDIKSPSCKAKMDTRINSGRAQSFGQTYVSKISSSLTNNQLPVAKGQCYFIIAQVKRRHGKLIFEVSEELVFYILQWSIIILHLNV